VGRAPVARNLVLRIAGRVRREILPLLAQFLFSLELLHKRSWQTKNQSNIKYVGQISAVIRRHLDDLFGLLDVSQIIAPCRRGLVKLFIRTRELPNCRDRGTRRLSCNDFSVKVKNKTYSLLALIKRRHVLARIT
jgi:hypothetical protein